MDLVFLLCVENRQKNFFFKKYHNKLAGLILSCFSSNSGYECFKTQEGIHENCNFFKVYVPRSVLFIL